MVNVAEEIEVIQRLKEIRESGTNYQENSQVNVQNGKVLTCSDGFSVRVAAGWGAKSVPNPGWGGCPDNYSGPYDGFEICNPSEQPEPWGLWRLFCSDEETPTEANYYYVPYVMIEQLLLDHEGFTPEGFSVSGMPSPQLPPHVEMKPSALATTDATSTTGVVGGKTLRGVFTRYRTTKEGGGSFSALPKPGGGLERFYHRRPTEKPRL